MLSNTLDRRIEWGDCDPAGIVFNPRYFAFFDHGSAMLIEAAGWTKPVLIQTFGIVGIPLVDTRAKFLAPCAFGDDVKITSTFVEVRRSSFDIRHELRRGDLLCVEGLETRVWTGRDLESGRLKSAPIPEIVIERMNG
ncbi:acyl-CoA thioesterase [Phenylobacterium sp.]|jgi:4-hydroxybenzoyl-CoA thioesterase|uniref:acyl-CoA thioesterase n=1 Tax=Phenylobacterium sp. TaxID=1871053 RepID=UPI0037845793